MKGVYKLVTLLCLLNIGCEVSPLNPAVPGPVWIQFKSPDQPFISNRVNTIVTHTNGQVWIGTDSGALFYDQRSWGVIKDSLTYEIFIAGRTLTVSVVKSIGVGKDGSVWFGTGGGGVRRFFQGGVTASETQWITYIEPTISYNSVNSIVSEFIVNGDVWLATPIVGINRFIPSQADPRIGRWELYTAKEIPEFGSNQIRTVGYNFNDFSIWVGTLRHLVAFFNDITGWRQYEIPPPHASTVLSIAFDRADNIWIGKLEGVSKLDESRSWSHYSSANTGGVLPRGPVNAVTTDLFDVRWFGTNNGLVKLTDTTWQRYNKIDIPELASDTITALSYDRRGNLWIGTTDGVTVYNPEGTNF